MTCHSSNYVPIAGFTIITLVLFTKMIDLFKYTKTTAIYEISYKTREKKSASIDSYYLSTQKQKGTSDLLLYTDFTSKAVIVLSWIFTL